MTNDRLDCGWCGSAASIEYGLCQVCLMEYPMDTKVIELPLTRAHLRAERPRTVRLPEPKDAVAEK